MSLLTGIIKNTGTTLVAAYGIEENAEGMI